MKAKQFLILLITTPLFLSFLLSFRSVIEIWSNTPSNVKSKLASVVSETEVEKINRFRQFNGEKVFFNKGSLVLYQFSDFLSVFSPRIYFQAGDGTSISPEVVSPINPVLIIFFLLGIYELLKTKKYKLFLWIIAFGALAFATGIRSFAYLFPVALTYLYIGFLGLRGHQRIFKLMILINLFLIIRFLWLKG